MPGDVGVRCCATRGSRRCVRSPRSPVQHRVDAVLVAGDVFDANLVSRTPPSSRRWPPCASFAGPWVLLPGNHDARYWRKACGPGCERLGGPPTCCVAAAAGPVTLADGRARRAAGAADRAAHLDDLTAWMDDADTPSGCVAGRSGARLGGGAPARGGGRGQPDRRRAGRARPARLSGAGRLARHARDRAAHLVCRHARARPVPRQRRRQRAAGRVGRARRTAAGRAAADRRYTWRSSARLGTGAARTSRRRRGPGCSPSMPEPQRAVVQLDARGRRRSGGPCGARCGARRAGPASFCHLDVSRTSWLASPASAIWPGSSDGAA